MVAFTGDMIDESSGPRPREGMVDMYSVAIESGLPWAASLGNHEDVVPGMTRDVIYDYILGLGGRALSAHGPIATSPGNFYVDLDSGGRAVARLVFFDSRNDDRFVNASTHSITDAQARPRTHRPRHACTHASTPPHAPMPPRRPLRPLRAARHARALGIARLVLQHLRHAAPSAHPRLLPHTARAVPDRDLRRGCDQRAHARGGVRLAPPQHTPSQHTPSHRVGRPRRGRPQESRGRTQERPQEGGLQPSPAHYTVGSHVCSACPSQISADKPNPRTFDVLKAGGVVGGFCGHDHTNDFCTQWQGVQLCYEGSPGFGAYGSCQGATCYQRRVRVTEIALTPDRSAVATIRSWKRLDGGGSVAGPVIDDELLWASEPAGAGGSAGLSPLDASYGTQLRRPVSAAEAAGLVRKGQPLVRPAEERAPVALVALSLVAAAPLMSV